jgi:hypothetical protein
LKEVPDLIEFIETIFDNFFDRFCQECEKIKAGNELTSETTTTAMEILYRYLKLFPFQTELLFCSIRANEETVDSCLYLETKKTIMEIHSLAPSEKYAPGLSLNY